MLCKYLRNTGEALNNLKVDKYIHKDVAEKQLM